LFATTKSKTDFILCCPVVGHPLSNRLRLSSTQAIFLIVNNRSMASLSKTVHEVYREYHDPDGFLYLSYASHEAFGSDSVT
jgi:microtubule-associated protein 1 light chain